MKATLLFPGIEQGRELEQLTIFAARRCRTVKPHSELLTEVLHYSTEKKSNFIRSVVYEEWAADVLEMVHIIFDLENIPYWLVMELLRHRLVAREFSLEQLSQRAINSDRLPIQETEYPELNKLIEEYTLKLAQLDIPYEDVRNAYPQGVLVNLVIAGNLRAFHHFFFMRSSELYQGKGGAHPLFMQLADSMQDQLTDVIPNLMKQILPA